MSRRIDFTDRSIIDVYRELAEGNVRALERFIDNMETICRQHSYLPLITFTNSAIDFYEGDFRYHVMTCFENWRNSDSSLETLAIKVGAGPEAANTGRRLMEELGSGLSEMFRRTFQRVAANTEAPVLEKEDILKTNEEIVTLIRSAENTGKNAEFQCISRSDWNEVYLLIKPVITNTAQSLCESFKSMISRVLEGSELFAAGVRSTVDAVQVGRKMDDSGLRWPSADSFI